jgi:hypothetical protein
MHTYLAKCFINSILGRHKHKRKKYRAEHSKTGGPCKSLFPFASLVNWSLNPFKDNLKSRYIKSKHSITPYLFKKVKVSLIWKSTACIKKRLSTSAHTSQSPTRNEKEEKQQRLMRIRRVVSRAFRPAPSLLKPAALPVTPPSDSPLSLLLLRCILCLLFVILFKLFIARQCSLVTSWCTLSVGTPKFS